MFTNNTNDSNFLDNSILFDIYEYPEDANNLENLVQSIMSTLYPMTGFKKTGDDFVKYFSHLKIITLNIFVSTITSRPIAYSRNRNNYSSVSRYSRIQTSYIYTIKLIDKLIDLGYLHHKKGTFFTNNRKVSRFWPTDKFIELLKNAKLTLPEKVMNTEVIRLHAKKHHKYDKKLASYNDSDHQDIPHMRSDLNLINKINSLADIRLNINNDVISGNFLKRVTDNNLFKNVLNVNSSDIPYKIMRFTTTNIIDVFNNNSICDSYNYSDFNIHENDNKSYLMQCYNIIPITSKTGSLDKAEYDELKKILQFMVGRTIDVSIGKSCNEYYYVNNLDIKLLDKAYCRVFNENFDRGGRFYNANIQQIPKYLRKYLTINGNETVELDYSAEHLRMLYQKVGIDYRDDPYKALIDQPDKKINYLDDVLSITPTRDEIKLIMDKTGIFPIILIFTKYRKFKNLNERTKYKIAQLILINAMSKFDKKGKEMTGEDVAIKAIMSELIYNGVANVKREMVEEIINNFKKVHKPIVEFLFSGIALELQNLDSKIMNEIKVNLANQGISALSYHDSIRIEKQHEALLRQLMMDVYKKHVGFYPVI